uniref:Uncharacterized protein n=1 Tax=viral metagenome TaxID=1070528 RepID=A0A6H1ZKY1_9ZZZZ
MARTPITKSMLKKHKGSLRGYYLAEGEEATVRAANAPGSFSDIPKSDIRSMQIADRLYKTTAPVERIKKKKGKPTVKEYGRGVRGLIDSRLSKYEEALGR